jgi:hypothetical protein
MSYSYTPATYTAGTIQPVYLTAPPVGFVPVALPTSAGRVAPPKQKGSFTAGLKGAWDKFSTKAQATWNESTDDRFRKYFAFPYSEQLFGEFWGEIWTGGHLSPCSAYLSTNWLCVEAKVKDPITRNKLPLKAQIPLNSIIRVQRAVTLPSMSGGAPVIQAVSDPAVRADSVQIFTRDGLMHQFTHFYNFEKFLATLEYLWHAATSTATQAGGAYQSQSTALPNTVPLHQPLHQPTITKEYEPVQTQPTTQAGVAFR